MGMAAARLWMITYMCLDRLLVGSAQSWGPDAVVMLSSQIDARASEKDY